MVTRGCCGVWAKAPPARLATITVVEMTVCACRGLLPSPLWGGAEGGGPKAKARPSRLAPPPSLTLPRKGGGNTPPVVRESGHHIPTHQPITLAHQLIIDRDAPGDAADRDRDEGLAGLGVDDGDVVAE